MNTEIQIFNNPIFGEIRVTEIEGKTYFVGSDVAKALGYANPPEAIATHCKSSNIVKRYIAHETGNGGAQKFEKRHVDVLKAIKYILQTADNQVTQNCVV